MPGCYAALLLFPLFFRCSTVDNDLLLLPGTFTWPEARQHCASRRLQLALIPDSAAAAARRFLLALHFRKRVWTAPRRSGARRCRCLWEAGFARNVSVALRLPEPDSRPPAVRNPECLALDARSGLQPALCSHYMAGALCTGREAKLTPKLRLGSPLSLSAALIALLVASIVANVILVSVIFAFRRGQNRAKAEPESRVKHSPSQVTCVTLEERYTALACAEDPV